MENPHKFEPQEGRSYIPSNCKSCRSQRMMEPNWLIVNLETLFRPFGTSLTTISMQPSITSARCSTPSTPCCSSTSPTGWSFNRFMFTPKILQKTLQKILRKIMPKILQKIFPVSNITIVPQLININRVQPISLKGWVYLTVLVVFDK